MKQQSRLNYNALNDIISKGFANGIKNYRKGFREAEIEAITLSENTFGGGIVYNFINFNYTSVIDSCFEALRAKNSLIGIRTFRGNAYNNQLGKVIHVHGTVHRDMVLGVNDTSQISDLSLFDGFDDEYINELIKQKTNEINEENLDRKTFELLKTSDLIYVYGMSIGETDKLWWERICELMTQKPNLHIIIHNFEAPEDGLIRRTFRLFVNNAKKAFTAYSKLEENKKKGIEARIHIDNTNIFKDLTKIIENPVNVLNDEKILTTVS